MRQGNGSDLLGANDPRSATIGVIYVAPNDDRESVLAAILTQEKLGRKQIAIVLPNQNKAFQRPVDFDGLKNMRRKLQSQLVIIAPYGSSPAELARQRHFSIYTSLENYGQSLRDENEASRASRRGGWSLFGGRQPKSQTGNEGAAKDSEQIPTSPLPVVSQNRVQPPPSNVDEEIDEQHRHPAADAAAMGLGLGAAAFAADHFLQTPGDKDVQSPPLMHHNDASDDDLALSAPSPQVGNSSPASGVPAQDEMKPPSAEQGPAEDGTPAIITFPSTSRARGSNNSPVSADRAEPDEEPVPVIVPPPSPAPIGRRSSGKMPAAGAAGAAAVPFKATGTPGSGGGVPPTRANGGGGQPPGQPRQSRLRWLLLALVALLLLSLLLCAVTALAAPGALPGPLKNIMSGVVGGTPSATVTITPKSADLHNTYVITGITTGTPDSARRQVRARVLTPVTETQAKSVAATGVLNIPATRATGTLTFSNGSNIDLVVKASSFAISVNGVQIKLRGDVDVPPATPSGNGTINAAAYADPPGANGNIAAGTISQFCCGSNSLSVRNLAAFGGGTNASTATIVQQSDINNAANPLVGPLKQTALASPNFKKQSGEQFLPNSPQCNTSVSSDQLAGAQAQSVTVTVTVRCSGEVYDQSGAQAIAANLLRSEAAKGTGTNYVLAGNIVTTVTQPTVGNTGVVTLFVKAEGIWVYEFTGSEKAALAGLIAGKSQSEANTLLLQQAGVQKVNSITLSGGTTLPTDAKQIIIVVENVPGLQGTPVGTPGSGTPTFTTSPIPRPSPSTVPGK